jgi:hypothetical protein
VGWFCRYGSEIDNVDRRNISEVSKREKILRHLNLFRLKEKLTKEVGTKEANEIKVGMKTG